MVRSVRSPRATPPLLPERATADGTLRRLQEAALVLFAERGYHGVSMRELAAETGVRASSLYAHLPSKEHLLRDLVLLGHEEHRASLRRALVAGGGDPVAQLTALVEAHVEFHACYPLLATVANNEMHALAPESLREVRRVRSEAEGLFTEVISRGVREGVFDVPDPWLALAAIGAIGIRVAAWYRDDSRFTVAEVVAADVLFALRIVGAAPEGRRRPAH